MNLTIIIFCLAAAYVITRIWRYVRDAKSLQLDKQTPQSITDKKNDYVQQIKITAEKIYVLQDKANDLKAEPEKSRHKRKELRQVNKQIKQLEKERAQLEKVFALYCDLTDPAINQEDFAEKSEKLKKYLENKYRL
ncbi:MAG: hypothetical protein M3Z87_03300 [Lactobacillus sp.]|nr:hypothetical protein [Lactobacillus sp.]